MMDWLAFVSSIVKAVVSWPVAAVIALFVLKRQIAAVFVALGDRLLTFKFAGVEATFAERIDKIEEKLPATVVELISSVGQKQIEDRTELSKLPPAYVVSQEWIKLQQAIYEAVEEVHPGAGVDGNRDLMSYLGLARLYVLLHPDEEPVVQELLILRNQAVHSGHITPTDALRYYDFAEALIDNVKERVEQAKSHASARRANPRANS